MSNVIPIFIGYDYRERVGTNILIDSLYQNSTLPLSITPLVTSQLEKQKIFYRKEILNKLQNSLLQDFLYLI